MEHDWRKRHLYSPRTMTPENLAKAAAEKEIDDKVKDLKRKCFTIWNEYSDRAHKNMATDYVEEKIQDILNYFRDQTIGDDVKHVASTSKAIAKPTSSGPSRRKLRKH